MSARVAYEKVSSSKCDYVANVRDFHARYLV